MPEDDSWLRGDRWTAEEIAEMELLRAAEINELPDRVKQYIHDLETNADPAGTIQELGLLKDQTKQLDAKIAGMHLMLMNAISACVHYQEYIDTDLAHGIDLMTAQMMFTSNQALVDWISDNAVLLPMRRDSLDFLEVLDRV